MVYSNYLWFIVLISATRSSAITNHQHVADARERCARSPAVGRTDLPLASSPGLLAVPVLAGSSAFALAKAFD